MRRRYAWHGLFIFFGVMVLIAYSSLTDDLSFGCTQGWQSCLPIYFIVGPFAFRAILLRLRRRSSFGHKHDMQTQQPETQETAEQKHEREIAEKKASKMETGSILFVVFAIIVIGLFLKNRPLNFLEMFVGIGIIWSLTYLFLEITSLKIFGIGNESEN